jgi:arylsulfatase A-like enzyme/Tfp pilus assembly protein PilF
MYGWKRAIIPVVIAVGALTLVAVLLRSTARPASPRPLNVLLITIDTLRADRVGAYGARTGATPTLDRLAARGLVFRNAFSAVPITLASHATLLTGRYPPRHGVRGNSFYRLPDAELTLAGSLKRAGYQTAAFVGAAVLDHRFGLSQGFDRYDDEMKEGTDANLIAERRASIVISRAIAWLQEPQRHAPFFLWVHLFDPHHPYDPPEPFRSRFGAARYEGEIAYADDQIGHLISALETADRLDGTLVVATSDHGESLGEHGEATHGVLLYDSTLRVPLIMAGPGVPRGVWDVSDVGLVDIVPTILARLGRTVPSGLDGRDMLGSISRAALYAETYLPRDFYNWSELRAIRSTGLKYIDAPQRELYDIAADPGEMQNLIDDRGRDVRGLAAALVAVSAENAGAAGAHVTADPDLMERLRSLGYTAGEPAPFSRAGGGTPRPNPRSRIHLIPLLNRALALNRAGQWQDAATELRAVLAEDSGNYLAARTLGDALFDLGRDDEAIAAYRRALANGRDAAYYHYRLGLLRERQGVYTDAAAEFHRLIEINPRAATEIADRADRLLAKGATAGALAYYQALDAAAPGPAPALRVADAHLRLGQIRRAIETLERAHQTYPADEPLREALVRTLNTFGAIRGDGGDLAGALQAFARALALAPSDCDTLANYGMARLRAGQTAPALEMLTRALALRPREVRLLNPVAELRFRRGELGLARDLLMRSLAVDPHQPQIEAALREVERRLATGS